MAQSSKEYERPLTLRTEAAYEPAYTAEAFTYLEFYNCSLLFQPTNGGIVHGIAGIAGASVQATNFVSQAFELTPQVLVTNASIYTNMPFPLLVINTGTATVGRTNWLPRISFAGKTNFGDLTIGVKDGNFTAAGTNLTIRCDGDLAKIDGQASYTITSNGAAAYFRVLGTNWTRVAP